MIPLYAVGPHEGYARRVARGVRLASRPYVTRWQGDYEDPDVALKVASFMVERPRKATTITWVPGHDGTPGPGYALAEALAMRWGLRLEEHILRRKFLNSSHDSTTRPTCGEVKRSLQGVPPVSGDSGRHLLVVDNVIASGASMVGSLQSLLDCGWTDIEALSITVDMDAGVRRYLAPGNQHLWIPGADCAQAQVFDTQCQFV